MSFFEELKRRNVVRVGIAYVVIGWVLAQVAEFAFENFGAPDWVLKTFVVVLLLGLPLALFFAWAFEITPEGVKREKDVDRSQSITPQTGRKLDRIIIGVLGVAVAFLLIDEFLYDRGNADSEVVATERQSIAVLPFENMSDDNDNFADGLTEEILNVLVKNPDLQVAGRTSAFAFKGQTPSSNEVGEALNVDHYVEGSVRRSGDRLRVTAQLIKVDDGFHVWSETYDREMADIFDIQDDVAHQISRQLNLRLSPDADRYTESVEAYALYLEALPYIANNSHPDLPGIVIDLLDRAIEFDPRFAKAYEARALTYWITAGERIDSGTARQYIAESAREALAFDDSLVLARYLYAAAGDPSVTWLDELGAAEAAIAADPDNFDILRSWCSDLIQWGYLEEAKYCTDRMLRMEPLSPVSHWRSGNVHSALGDRETSIRRYTRGAELGGSSYAWTLAMDAVIDDDFEQAAEIAQEAVDEFAWQPDDIQEVRRQVDTGGRAAVREWIAAKATEAPGFFEQNNAYYWYLSLGDLDRYWGAIEQIQAESGESWDNSGYLLEIGIASRRTGFTGHPGFLRYAERSGLTDVWDRRGPPDFCDKIDDGWVCE
jgi:TolB-like protein